LAVAGWSSATLAPGITLATIAFAAGFFLLFELSYEVIYDLRDAPGDAKAEVRSYPVVHGQEGAVKIIDGLIASSLAVIVIGYALGNVPWRIFIMAAAPQADYEAAEPLLKAMGSRLYHVGQKAGDGAMVKTINQLLCGVHIAAAAEALALGERAGLDTGLLLEIFGSSAAGSWMLNNRGPRMLMEDPPVTSAVDIFVKDLGIVLDAGHSTRAPLFLAAAAHQLFLAASGMGLGKADDALVIEAYRAMAPKPAGTPRG